MIFINLGIEIDTDYEVKSSSDFRISRDVRINSVWDEELEEMSGTDSFEMEEEVVKKALYDYQIHWENDEEQK